MEHGLVSLVAHFYAVGAAGGDDIAGVLLSRRESAGPRLLAEDLVIQEIDEPVCHFRPRLAISQLDSLLPHCFLRKAGTHLFAQCSRCLAEVFDRAFEARLKERTEAFAIGPTHLGAHDATARELDSEARPDPKLCGSF